MSISTDMGGDYLSISAGPNTTLSLTWKSAAGAVKEKATLTTDSYGNVYYNPSDGTVVAIGDRIKISDGSKTHKLVVPPLSITVNRVRDRLKGTGPAGDSLKIFCGGNGVPAFEPCIWQDRVRVDSTGHWADRLWDFRGGQMFNVRWKSAAGDEIWLNGTAPYVYVTVGQAKFSGAFGAGQTAHIVVRDGTTLDPLATGSGDGDPQYGDFSGKFRDSDGHVYKLKPGDLISSDIAADLDFVVPDIQATADAATDTVSGQCFPTSGYVTVRVDVYRNGVRRGFAFDDTENDSTFSTYMPHPGTIAYKATGIKVGDRVSVACRSSLGDWVRVYTTAS